MASHLLKEDNTIRIDEAIFKRNSKKLNISFVLTYAIDYETYKALENHVSNLLGPLNLTLDYSFGYEDINSYRYKINDGDGYYKSKQRSYVIR